MILDLTYTELDQLMNKLETLQDDKIKKFVLENKDLLLALCNGSIDYRTDFLPNMHKIKD